MLPVKLYKSIPEPEQADVIIGLGKEIALDHPRSPGSKGIGPGNGSLEPGLYGQEVKTGLVIDTC